MWSSWDEASPSVCVDVVGYYKFRDGLEQIFLV